MGLTYPNKFTYVNTFVIELSHRCLDNGGPTVQAELFIPLMLPYRLVTLRTQLGKVCECCLVNSAASIHPASCLPI